uniref:Radial spoke head 14 homolog n=1 Tax=Periophthalmus magnuspinnatus TaxID=409849 RepID=A0A3B3ZKE8_9GOBI
MPTSPQSLRPERHDRPPTERSTTSRAPVAYGLRAVPRLFEDLQRPDSEQRKRALTSLCDLLHEPERLRALLSSSPPLLLSLILTLFYVHSHALLSSSLLTPLSLLLDDPDSHCRISVHRVLNRLSLLPSGLMGRHLTQFFVSQEEELVLLLSTLARCSHLDALPALASDGVALLRDKLSHGSAHVRREAAAAMLALSIPLEGKRQICALGVLSDLLTLLRDPDTEVRANAAGVCMNTFVITAGTAPSAAVPLTNAPHIQCHCSAPIALVLYCLRALTALSEAPAARCRLMKHRPCLERKRDTDPELRQATETLLRVISWTP